MTIRGCLVPGTARVEALGESKKERKKGRRRNWIFTVSRLVTLASCPSHHSALSSWDNAREHI